MEDTTKFAEAMTQAPADADNLEVRADENADKADNASNVVVDESQPAEQHDFKERYESSTAEARKLNEAYQRTIEANVKIAEKNPEFLEELADTDQSLANEVSQKLHGVDYETHQRNLKLEELKEDDPSEYEREKRLQALEARHQLEQKTQKESFFKEKGIIVNEYDPNYKKVMDVLNNFKPDFVENNMLQALDMAYVQVFGAKKVSPQEEHLANQTSPSGKTAPVEFSSKPKMSPAAQNFNNQFKSLL